MVNILVNSTYATYQEVLRVFEYGKDIPLEGAVMGQVNQPAAAEESAKAEGSAFPYDHRKEIPMDGINK